MFKINRKKIASIISLSCCTFITYIAPSNHKLNYESLYQLHLKWEIEDLNTQRIKLEAQLEENQRKQNAPEIEKTKIQHENENMQHTINQLQNQKNISYHLTTQFTRVFQLPRPYRGKYPIAGMVWELQEWTRFVSAYLLLPISAPLTAINAGQEWLSKQATRTDQITKLEKKLEENNNTIARIKPLSEDTIARLEKEAAKIETDIVHIKLEIAQLEIEKKELKNFNHFKANFKFRYL